MDSTYRFEQLLNDLNRLDPQDYTAVVPLAVGVNSVLNPADCLENCQRQIQFITFELQQDCKGLDGFARWEVLRNYFYTKKEFSYESNLWLKQILQNRSGHPLALGFLLVYFANQVGISLQLIQARHHYIVRLTMDNSTSYFDLLNHGHAMSDDDLVKALHRSASNLEAWNARQLLIGYLEEMSRQFEMNEDWERLLKVYDLYLQLDENCTSVIGLRGLLRHKLGLHREALTDLKRYFSFVEKNRAPIEIQMALQDLEGTKPQLRVTLH